MDEIVQHGYDDTSMAQIAARAGASKETLYAWFGDKSGLIQALIESNADLAVRVPEPESVSEDSSLAEVRMRCLPAVFTGHSAPSPGTGRLGLASPRVENSCQRQTRLTASNRGPDR